MKYLIPLFTFTFNLNLLFAAWQNVSVDENNDIQPPEARQAVTLLSSSIVQINLAKAEVEIVTNLAATINKDMEELTKLLTERSDGVIVQAFANGLEDARGQGAAPTEGLIEIVSATFDSTDPIYAYATLTWQYVTGSFNTPRALASGNVATNESGYAAIPMTEPEQISWGTNSAFRATATIDKRVYGDRCFIKIAATPDAPVDDGQVFNTYGDDTWYEIIFVPNRRYKMKISTGGLIGPIEVLP